MNMTRFELENRIAGILYDVTYYSNTHAAVRYDLKKQWWSGSGASDWQWLCCYKLNDSQEGDCDVSLHTMVFFATALGLREKWYITRQIKSAMNYQLELRRPPKSKAGRAAEYVLRGDTMNSYATTMHAYLDLLDKDKKINPKGECWEALVLRDSEKMEELLSPAAREFITRVHTIGNMLPVPFQAYAPDTEDGRRASFNRPRYAKTKDYFDLTLLCLYAHFTGDSDGTHTVDWLLSNEGDRALCRRWLDSFGKGREGWRQFVEQNLLQDFVNQADEGDWGKPKELWKGHFKGSVEPKQVEQCEAFFTNASTWIWARGIRMVLKTNEQRLKEQDDRWGSKWIRRQAEKLLPKAKSAGEG